MEDYITNGADIQERKRKSLFYFPVKVIKYLTREELSEGNVKAVAEFLYCGYGNITSAFIHHTVSGGRSNTGYIGKLVNFNISFPANG